MKPAEPSGQGMATQGGWQESKSAVPSTVVTRPTPASTSPKPSETLMLGWTEVKVEPRAEAFTNPSHSMLPKAEHRETSVQPSSQLTSSEQPQM